MGLIDRLPWHRRQPTDWIALREAQELADARLQQRLRERRALCDLSGWMERSRPESGKWAIPAGRIARVSEAKAREFAAKGFVQILADLSDDPLTLSFPVRR